MTKTVSCFRKNGKPKKAFNTSVEARQAIKDVGNHANMCKWWCETCQGYHIGHKRELNYLRVEQLLKGNIKDN